MYFAETANLASGELKGTILTSMATEHSTSEGRELECPVCHEEFSVPKILPCAHLLCRDCLLTWLRADMHALCPMCRCAIVDPDNDFRAKSQPGDHVTDQVDTLPTDLAMAAMVESAGVLCTEHVCCSCVNVPAASICLNCSDTLCQSCATAHGRLSVSRYHEVVELKSLTTARLASHRPATCPTHSVKPSELYCRTHGTIICHLCATEEHRECSEVTSLEKRLEEARAALADLSAKLRAGENDLEQAITRLDQQLEDSERRARAALNEIDEACDRLARSLEACRTRLKELVNHRQLNFKSRARQTRASLLEKRGKLTSHRRLVERSQTTAPRNDFCDVTSLLQTRVEGLFNRVGFLENLNIISMASLTIDPRGVVGIERQLTSLGEPAGVRFHANHGTNIALSDDRQTAEKVRGDSHAIVMVTDPMGFDTLFEVRVDELETNTPCLMRVGVVETHPSGLTLPWTAWEWEKAVVVSTWGVCSRGKRTDNTVNQVLGSLYPGSRVGVLVDAARCLHLYVDGIDQGVAAFETPEMCYAMFELRGSCKKVIGLPVTHIEPTSF